MLVLLLYHQWTALFPFDSRAILHQGRRIDLVVLYTKFESLQLREILYESNDKLLEPIHGRDVVGLNDTPVGEVSRSMLSAKVGDFAFRCFGVFEGDDESHLFDVG